MFRRFLTSPLSTFLLAPDAPAPPVPAAPAPAPIAPPTPAAPAAVTPPPPAPALVEPAPDQTVPYDRFKEVNDELQKLKDDQAARDRAQLPELERARAEAEDARTKAAEAERERDEVRKEAETVKRQGWIREAARVASFHDPEDAVLRIDTDGVATEDAAKRAVQTIVDTETLAHLINKPAEPTPTTGDLLARVLNEGKTVDGTKPDGTKPVIPADQFNALTADQLVSLQETDADLYDRSLRAAAQPEQ